MTKTAEGEARKILAREYGSALKAYISGAGEAALTRARELGRKAAGSGIGLQEMATIHHEALLALSPTGPPERPPFTLAAEFFAESLSPFEMALRRAKEAAEDANRELESFSYSVAHDLRTPLRSIEGFGKILLDSWATQLDPKAKKYLHFVRESAQEMAHLIDDLLALSRVSRSDLRPVHVDLSALARGIAERLQAIEPGRQVDFLIQDSVFGDGDSDLLAAVLENLLGNAWKFTGKRERGRIEFGMTQEDGRTTYFVRDNGAGFDMAYVGKLFGVFQRLHSADDFEGNGIGLATVRRIIRRHGGRVWAEGATEQGATFYFTLGDQKD